MPEPLRRLTVPDPATDPATDPAIRTTPKRRTLVEEVLLCLSAAAACQTDVEALIDRLETVR